MGGISCLFVPGGTTLTERNRAVVGTKCSARKENVELGGWRDFRLRLIEKEGGRVGVSSRGWAHEVNVIEPGTCLISNANHQWSETHKHRNKAVVLVTKATDTEFTGLMLNRELGQYVHDIPSIEARVGREFRDNPVHLGGDCSLGTIEMIHSVQPERCPGAEVRNTWNCVGCDGISKHSLWNVTFERANLWVSVRLMCSCVGEEIEGTVSSSINVLT